MKPSLAILEPLDVRTLFSSGQLDPAFNSGQLLSTAFDTGSSVIADVEVLPDGEILAAGTIRVRHGSVRTNQTQMALAKYHFDGTLDAAFGDGGKIAATPRGMDSAFKIEFTPDGGFIVMGTTAAQDSYRNQVPAGYEHPVSDFLLKFTAAGKIDATFGKNGVLKPDRITTFAVDPQGRILVGAFNEPTDRAHVTDATLTRYTASGTLDTSFNKTGQFISMPASVVGANDFRGQTFNSIAFDTKGHILASVLTYERVPNETSHLTIYRLTNDGRIDRGYANNGKAQVALPFGQEQYYSRQIARVLDDGSMILIGHEIARIDPAGELDTGYGTNGIADTTQEPLFLGDNIENRSLNNGFVVSADGSIVFANRAARRGVLQLIRLNATGHEDAGFANQGAVTLAHDPNAYADGYLNDVAIAPDGSLVCGGQNGFESPSTKVDTRTFVVGRIMSGEGPALHLAPRTLRSPSRYLSFEVLIRDPDSMDVNSLDNNDLKLFDAQGQTRKIRLLDFDDVNGDGKYIRARYRIIGPNSSAWSQASNGTYEVRLARKQIKDSAGNSATAQVLGTVRVLIR